MSTPLQLLQASGYPLLRGTANAFAQRFDVVSVRSTSEAPVEFKQTSSSTPTTTTVVTMCDAPPPLRVYYVKTDWLPQFVADVLPTLAQPIVLVSACSDMAPRHCFPRETRAILQSPLVLQWWAEQNDVVAPLPGDADSGGGYSDHNGDSDNNSARVRPHKVHTLPCGLGSCHSMTNRGWQSADREYLLSRLWAERSQQRPPQRTEERPRILCRWRARTSNVAGDEHVQRARAMQWAERNRDLCTIVDHELDAIAYLQMVAAHEYILCPCGNGLDPSPRAWEALAVGTVPILKSSTLDDAYQRLPCVIVADWGDITAERLVAERARLRRAWPAARERLTMDYWERLVRCPCARLTHCVMATDLNPLYSAFVPLACRAWREIVGVDVCVVVVGDAVPAEWPDDVRARSVLFAPVDGVPTGFQAQVVRLFASQWIGGDRCGGSGSGSGSIPGYVVLSDADILPLRRDYFACARTLADEAPSVLVYRHGAVAADQVAMCYCAATPQTWASMRARAFPHARDARDAVEQLWTMTAGASAAAAANYSWQTHPAHWHVDQRTLHRMVGTQANVVRLRDADTGFARLCRSKVDAATALAAYERNSSSSGEGDAGARKYVDFHMLRPHTGANKVANERVAERAIALAATAPAQAAATSTW